MEILTTVANMFPHQWQNNILLRGNETSDACIAHWWAQLGADQYSTIRRLQTLTTMPRVFRAGDAYGNSQHVLK
jgi:hypothetical protein